MLKDSAKLFASSPPSSPHQSVSLPIPNPVKHLGQHEFVRLTEAAEAKAERCPRPPAGVGRLPTGHYGDRLLPPLGLFDL